MVSVAGDDDQRYYLGHTDYTLARASRAAARARVYGDHGGRRLWYTAGGRGDWIPIGDGGFWRINEKGV